MSSIYVAVILQMDSACMKLAYSMYRIKIGGIVLG